jgi:hypothetical protein
MDLFAHHYQERPMSRQLLAACVFATVVASASSTYAQRFGTFGTSGLGGASGFGSSAFGSSSFGSGFGSSGFGSSGFGSSGFGSSGFGSSSFGSSFGSGFGGMGGFGSSSFGSSGFGSSSFGTSGAGGQNFVGRDSADMANVWNQLGRAGTQYFNQMNRSMNRGNNAASQQQAATVQNTPQPMLVNLRVAFTPRRPTAAALSDAIRTRLARILASQNIVAPQLTMEGDVAVLRGVAATDSQRLVLEKLVAMEPGVSAVRNEMTIAGSTATE